MLIGLKEFYKLEIEIMTLQERVFDEMKTAMKSGDTARRDILRVLMGQINLVGKVVSDEVVLSKIKSLKQSAELTINSGVATTDDIAQSELEIKILTEFQPTMLSEGELTDIINTFIVDNSLSGMKDMGKVMGHLKGNYNAQYDGKLASNLVKQLLA